MSDREPFVATLASEREKARDLGNQSAALARSIADVLNDALDALERAEADRDKIRDAASWLLANRGHRGEEQAWKLLADAVGDSE